MRFHTIIRIAEHAARADQSAVCAINRHLLARDIFARRGYSAYRTVFRGDL